MAEKTDEELFNEFIYELKHGIQEERRRTEIAKKAKLSGAVNGAVAGFIIGVLIAFLFR